MVLRFTAIAAASLGVMAGGALADTISPTTFSADLALGESVTITKTVTVEAAGTTSALIDAHFLIDTSGSMGGAIASAKSGAASILGALSAFGDLASGVGVFSEGATLSDVIYSDLSTTDATTIAAINTVTLGVPDGGGDYPESGDTAVDTSNRNLSWRPGSNRFIFVLSDASMKGTDEAIVNAGLAATGAKVIGIQFGTNCFSGEPGECNLTQSVAALGGTTYASTTSVSDIVAAVTAGITGSFANYSTVSISDLGAGDPLIDVSVACVTADIGACAGDTATGSYDRSVDRTFTFDVTFTRTGDGDSAFLTHALVNGASVASESDVFPGTAPVPLPAAGWLLLAGIAGLGVAGRRRRA